MEILIPYSHYLPPLLVQLVNQFLQASIIILLIALAMGCGHTLSCSKRSADPDRNNHDES